MFPDETGRLRGYVYKKPPEVKTTEAVQRLHSLDVVQRIDPHSPLW